jgi:hydrogenase expression/formation protein HypC
MCIGVPMQVREVGDDWVWAHGRDGTARVDTRLVGAVQAGAWLLVFQGAARERLSDQRAAEVQAALELLQAALAGGVAGEPGGDPGFALPSSISAADLSALTGGSRAEGD